MGQFTPMVYLVWSTKVTYKIQSRKFRARSTGSRYYGLDNSRCKFPLIRQGYYLLNELEFLSG